MGDGLLVSRCAVAAIVAPVLTAVGALAALATRCTIEVVRFESAFEEEQTDESGDSAD